MKAPAAQLNEMEDMTTRYCSFCGKDQHEVDRLIRGPEAYICDECVRLMFEMLDTPNPGDPDKMYPADMEKESEES